MAMVFMGLLGTIALAIPSAEARVAVGIAIGPPAPRYEAVPPYPPAYRPGRVVWQPGHWRWDGRDYDWVPGRYVEIPRHRHYRRWNEGHWEQRHGGWFWVEGRWR
jgi:hypothetical protein